MGYFARSLLRALSGRKKSFINQACLIKIAGYLICPLLYFLHHDTISLHKYLKRALSQYQALLHNKGQQLKSVNQIGLSPVQY